MFARTLVCFVGDGTGRRIKIVGAYAPQRRNTVEREVFFEDLFKLVPPSLNCIVMGDFNLRMGAKKGEHSVREQRLQRKVEDELAARSLWDASKTSNARGSWTWGGRTGVVRGKRARLDFAFVRMPRALLRRCRTLDVRLATDHRMVVLDLLAAVGRARTKGRQTRRPKLPGKSRKSAFKKKQGGSEQEWRQLANDVQKFEAPREERSRSAPYISQGTWEVIEKKRRAKKYSTDWRLLQEEVRVRTRADREAWVESQLRQTEELLDKQQTHEAYMIMRKFYREGRVRRTLPTQEEIDQATTECHKLLSTAGTPPVQEHTSGPPSWPQEHVPEGWKEVYTDGSCTKDSQGMDQAGFGVFLPATRETLSGRVHGPQTAQRGEVSAVAAALLEVRNTNIALFTDSSYVVEQMKHLSKFRANGAEGQAHEDLWRTIAVAARGREIRVTKVKAHSGDSANDAADEAAKAGRAQQPVDMGMRKWDEAAWDGKINDECPTSEEIVKAAKSLRKDAASGDRMNAGTVTEALEDEVVGPRLVKFIQQCWKGELALPQAWCDVTIVLIRKKSGGHRMIGLEATGFKIISKILAERMSCCPMRNQFGFTAKRSTLFPILGVKLAVQKARETGQRLWVAFVDVVSAYYTVDRERMLAVLQAYGLGPNLTRILAEAFEKERMAVRLEGRFGNAFHGERGVRAGDCASPILFNVLLDSVLRKLKHRLWFYADDGVLMAHSAEELQTGLDALAAGLKEIGLKLSVAKTKVMCFRPPKFHVHVSDEAYAAAFRKEAVEGYTPARQRCKEKIVCENCGRSVCRGSLKEHLRTKVCRSAGNAAAASRRHGHRQTEHAADAEQRGTEHQAEAEQEDAEHQAEAEQGDAEHQAEAEQGDAEHQAEAEQRDAEHQAEAEQGDAEHQAEAEQRDAEHQAEAEQGDAEHQAEAEQRYAEHQVQRARVSRGAHGRVCVDMGVGGDLAVRCPFPCSFVATSREAMVAHMRHRHL